MIFGKPEQPLRETKPPLRGKQPRTLAEWLKTATWNLVSSAQARIRTEIAAFNFLPKPKPPLRSPKPPLGRQKPRTLAEWLETATWNLVPSAQTRVQAEIEAHYAEAVQARLDNGATEPAAQAAALADLGDATAAARRFRREHLTDKDAAAITGSINLARSKPLGTNFFLGVLFFALFVVITQFFFFWHYPQQADDYVQTFFTEFTFLLIIVVFAILRATHIPAGQKITAALLRQIILLRAVAFAIYSALLLNICASNVLSGSQSHHLRDKYLIVRSIFTNAAPGPSLNGYLSFFHFLLMAIWGLAILLCVRWFANGALHLIRLRQKLQSTNEADLPPRDPASA